MQKARINLASIDIGRMNQICESIKDIAKKTKTKISGPIPLPTKVMKMTTRESPCGDGTATWEKYEMRVHKRLIDILNPNSNVIDALMNLTLPAGVDIEIKL